MPAHIGFFEKLKVPVLSVVQFTPTDLGKHTSKMGYVTPGQIYQTMKNDRDNRESTATTYLGFRQHLNKFDPHKKESTTTFMNMGSTYLKAADANEWDLYLKPGTTFDNGVRTVLDRKEGWTITFVTHKSDNKLLKRIEIKRGKGHTSVTLWSCSGSAKMFA